MLYEIKPTNFILLFNTNLMVISWQYRVIIRIHFIVKCKELSLFFRKKYNAFIYYLETKDIIITRSKLKINYNKERTFIEYQICITDYFEDIDYILSHLQIHALKTQFYTSAIRIDVYVFIRDKQLPERIQISFNRIRFGSLVKDINTIFKFAKNNYNRICLEDKYNIRENPISHIAMRLFFNAPPVRVDLLYMEGFYYYTKWHKDYNISVKQRHKSILKEKYINKDNLISIKDLVSKAFINAGYNQDEVQFITKINDQ